MLAEIRAASSGPVPSMKSNACGALNNTTIVTPTVVATKITSSILSTTVATSCHSTRTLVLYSYPGLLVHWSVCLSLPLARHSISSFAPHAVMFDETVVLTDLVHQELHPWKSPGSRRVWKVVSADSRVLQLCRRRKDEEVW